MASKDQQAMILAAAMRAEGLLDTISGLIAILVKQMSNRAATIDADRVDTWSSVLQWIGGVLDDEVVNLADSLNHDQLVADRVAP